MSRERFRSLLENDGRSEEERERLVSLMELFARLPLPPDPEGDFTGYGDNKERFLAAAEGGDGDALEESFLHLYAHIHMHEARYTEAERKRMDETGGYWAHAGGVNPLIKAGPWIEPDSVSIDLGAGNGLQGLLFQYLDPHKKTIQVEISSRMIEIGKRLQDWIGIPEERVEWVAGDVCDQSLEGIDFIYLYRPVRPSTADGRGFYERLADFLEMSERRVVVFSIADCLKEFVSSRVEIFYNDGHLACFRNP